MSTHATHPDTSAPRDDQAVIAAHDPDRLLHALAVLDFNPPALAEQLDVSPFALADWLESDETQRQLTRYQSLERQMLDLRALKSRRITIESLEHVLETTQDLAEKRRTATTLLRLLTHAEPGSVSDHGTSDAPSPFARSPAPRPESSTASHPAHTPESGERLSGDADLAHAEPGSVSDHGTSDAPSRFERSPAPRPESPSASELTRTPRHGDKLEALGSAVHAAHLPAPKPHQLE